MTEEKPNMANMSDVGRICGVSQYIILFICASHLQSKFGTASSTAMVFARHIRTLELVSRYRMNVKVVGRKVQDYKQQFIYMGQFASRRIFCVIHNPPHFATPTRTRCRGRYTTMQCISASVRGIAAND